MSMETRILKPASNNLTDPAIEKAARLILAGQVVAVPTETVYGLAGDATNLEAVERIFTAKSRPADNPLIVHLNDVNMVNRYCVDVDRRALMLMEAFWPGPLTLVLKAGAQLKQTVCRGLDTVAVRMPDHPLIQALITRVDHGLAAPSANLSGKPSPTTAKDVLQDMDGRIPLILDGGSCRVGLESTVLDCSEERPIILRPGLVTAVRIQEILGEPVNYAHNKEAKKRSPGTRYRHYSPNALVFLLGNGISEHCRICLIRRLEQKGRAGYIGNRVEDKLLDGLDLVHLPENEETLPANLYRNLRAMDEHHVGRVIIDGVEESDAGRSVMDRLEKAASHYFRSDSDLENWLRQN